MLHIPRFTTIFTGLVGLLLLLSGCGYVTAPVSDNTQLPGRRQLARAARQAPVWRWVYYAADSATAAAWRELLQPLAEHVPGGQRLEILDGRSVPDSLLGAGPLTLVGADLPLAWRERLGRHLPLRWSEDGFDFHGERFNDERDLLKLFYVPNPWNTQQALHLFTGNSAEALLHHLQQLYGDDWSSLFWSSWGYEVYQHGRSRFLGYFNDSTWQVDGRAHFSFSTRPQQLGNSSHADYLGFDVQLPDTTLTNLIRDYENRYDSIRAFTSGRDDLHLSWYFYPGIEAKGLRLQDTRPASSVPDAGELHLVVDTIFRGDRWGEDARLLLRHWLGEPATAALLPGLALRFVPQWQEKGFRHWAARLLASDNMPPLQEVVDNELYRRESPLVMSVAAGALVDFLVDHWGKDTFLLRYPRWTLAAEAAPGELDREWRRWLRRTYPAVTSQVQHRPPEGFLKGFTFAHEGYRVYNGYGGDLAKQSLRRMTRMNTNAVAIVPYTFMLRPDSAVWLPVVQQAGTENDEATLVSVHTAKAIGQYVLLKPQIWVRGSWPGDIRFARAEDWDFFFDTYYRWLRHYTLLAAIHRLDALCIGTEMAHTTLRYPQRWREMIRRVRGLYDGTVTYAANWGEEFEQLTFWSDLDVAGVNFYYPLSDSLRASRADLVQGMNAALDRVAQVQRRAQRPVWLTEIGYRSISAPWINPHAEADGRSFHATDQADCYAVALQAMSERPWIGGVFWWKWPSYLDYDEDDRRGFTPLGKPAEDTVTRRYQDWDQD